MGLIGAYRSGIGPNPNIWGLILVKWYGVLILVSMA